MVPILVVDDNQAVADFCRLTLSEAGHSVITAHSAKEALEALERHTIDIILSDVRMPGVSGLDLLHLVSKGPLPPSVILMTGFDPQVELDEVRENGIALILRKPYGSAELENAVAQALAQADEAA